MQKLLNLRRAAALFAGSILSLSVIAAPDRAGTDLQQLLTQLRSNAGGPLALTWSPGTQAYNFIRGNGAALLMQDSPAQPAEDRARFFLSIYGALAGIQDQASELRYLRTDQDQTGTLHVRFAQRYNGLPVFGGDTVVHMNSQGILALSGALVPGLSGLNTVPALPQAQARSIALSRVAERHPKAALDATDSALAIYRSGLLGETQTPRSELAWAVTVRGPGVHEQLWISARDGAILNRIDRVEHARYRKIYSPSYDPASEDSNLVRREGDGPIVPVPVPIVGDPIDNLYDFAGEVYGFYFNTFGRDSYDSAGAKMHSVYLVNDQCPNAYWDGTATNYCPGFDADDVVAHEWSHAVTQYIDDLIYQYQPGALNESNSDVFGETIDLTNNRDGIGGSTNDKPYPDGERWLIAEDIGTGTVDPVPIVGKFVESILLRDMWDPDRLGSPGKVSSNNYICDPSRDNGGVHTNSGVPNHAYAILVDGKTYNGVTTTGIGLVKAANIYYKSKFFQGPSSNFVAHADALEAACQDLIGQPLKNFDGTPYASTITAADCQQVVNANTAVEMRKSPAQCNFQPILQPESATPALCGSGYVTPVLKETWDYSSGTLPAGWTLTSTGTGDAWPKLNWAITRQLPPGRGNAAIYAKNDRGGTCKSGGDISGSFSLTSPEVTLTNNASKIAFTHYVATESGFDGGNLSVSVNGGAFALVPDSSYSFNPPNATLNDAPPPTPVPVPDPVGLFGNNSNPMAGQRAWSGTDGGELHGSWGTTLVDLSALAKKGDKIKLRWTFGNDCANGVDGWYVDTTQVYSCEATAPVNHAPLASLVATTPTSGAPPLTVGLDASSSSDPDSDAITAYVFDFGDGAKQSGASPTASHTYTTDGDYTATVTVTDERGLSSTQQGTVHVSVHTTPANQPPTLSAFSATPSTADIGVSIAFSASASDPDGDVITYTFNFGDGSAPVQQTTGSASHAYTSAGTHTASVTVKDATHPESAPLTTAVTITTPGGGAPTNHAPDVSSLTADPVSGPGSAATPLNVHFTAVASDPDGDAFKYIFDFGDGLGTQSASGTVSHAYSAAGTYTASVQAIDAKNLAGSIKSVTITVTAIANRAPTAALTVSPASGETPLTIDVNAAASSDPDGDALTYSFDFGDGQKLLNSNAARVQHIYTVPGSYTVTLTVTDTQGLTSSKSAAVSATAAAAGLARPHAGGALGLALLLPLFGLAALRRRLPV